MNFKSMLEYLEKIYEENCKKVLVENESLTIPNLKGSLGSGKTSCVKIFAVKKEFKFIRLNCSIEPVNILIIHLNNAMNFIKKGKAKGIVLLLDNADYADDKYLEILNQYRENRLNAFMKIAKVDVHKKLIYPVKYDKIKVEYNKLFATIFIVCEQNK